MLPARDPNAKVISATEASKGFRELLDQVEREGRSVVIERRGRPVAVVSAAGPPTTTTLGELLDALEQAPEVDDDFEKDLEGIRRSAGSLPPDPWERS
jgi:prevent-host-death family protein